LSCLSQLLNAPIVHSELPLGYKLIDCFATLKRWVELDKRLRPQCPRSKLALNVLTNLGIANIDET
jgi:hypothetical protein